MNKADYRRYVGCFRDFFERNGVDRMSSAGAKCCGENVEDYICRICGETCYQEPYFSWRPCDCCRSSLGGDREDYVAYNKDFSVEFDVSICSDCVYFNEYGCLSDQDMVEVGKDRCKCRLRDGREGECIDFPNNFEAVVCIGGEVLTVRWDDVILDVEE